MGRETSGKTPDLWQELHSAEMGTPVSLISVTVPDMPAQGSRLSFVCSRITTEVSILVDIGFLLYYMRSLNKSHSPTSRLKYILEI